MLEPAPPIGREIHAILVDESGFGALSGLFAVNRTIDGTRREQQRQDNRGSEHLRSRVQLAHCR